MSYEKIEPVSMYVEKVTCCFKSKDASMSLKVVVIAEGKTLKSPKILNSECIVAKFSSRSWNSSKKLAGCPVGL